MKKKILSILNKTSNILFVLLLLSFLVAGLVMAVFFPKDINYYENRYCYKFSFPTVKTVMDSSFQDNVENTLMDQVPSAQGLKKLYNDTLSSFIGKALNPIIMNNDSIYINYKGSYLFGGQYVYTTYYFPNVKTQLDVKIENYNKLFEKYPDMDFYAYYIERDTDVNFESGEKVGAAEYLFPLLNLESDREKVFEINTFGEFSEYFYKTDHHWNHKGSYKAYLELAELLGIEDPIEKKGEVLIGKEYLGSKASAAGSEFIKEEFYAYEFDFPALEVFVNGERVNDYGAQKEHIEAGDAMPVTYASFYGDDNAETVFDSGKTDCANILVFGESYDNAVLKLLATHFNKTHSIDLRHYERSFGEKFNFSEYVKENNIEKVLFIGSGDFYCPDTFELEIG